jgi:hypothetical protein
MLQSGGRIARTNHLVELTGEKASSNLRALSMAAEAQLVDVHSKVVHVSGECTSQQEQRNVVAGRSRVVWKGAVVVPRGSDNTNAKQLCRTLLLSDDARVDVQPTLEIDTDEVECTHGATISDLDDEMVFYLQARGLSRPDARALLLSGWVELRHDVSNIVTAVLLFKVIVCAYICSCSCRKFSNSIICLIKSASPYPFVGYRKTEESVKPAVVFVSKDRSKRLPCSGWFIAPAMFTQLK